MCFILLGVSLYNDFEQRVFLSSLGPKTTIPIETDGNCGYRSISAGTTGLQDSHEDMRFDIQENTELSIDLYQQGLKGHSWLCELCFFY